ncbi:putative acid-sensing ion channel 1-like [Apostichopus japonicus]|uniref:Putative acid-sensing ion channel 1-like n=1 Tax=Stichopus japonicus TaxID=307972 RepID=A0A2G8LG86_STIJA|nr:putative acid-sensing ion channel 1-like [Apostichopus japonicus]
MAIWLVFGIMSGIRKYFTYPVSTVVEFNYVETIDFPAVTFCNYNQFQDLNWRLMILYFNRCLKLARGPAGNQNEHSGRAVSGHLRILLALVVKQGVDIDWDYHDSLYNDNHWNMTEVAITSGHQLEDMLLSCTWNRGEACGPQNFTTTITDFGICFTFNGDRDSGRRLTVSQAGASQGLRLRLSAEQDEYYWGYYTAAGFKLFVHPQGEFPLVDQLGVSFSPVSRPPLELVMSLLTSNMMSSEADSDKSLPTPYKSNCSDAKLQYSLNYSTEACWFECEAKIVTEFCGCRYYKYPDKIIFPLLGPVPLCSPRQIVQCVLPAQDSFSVLNIQCDCPVSCMHESYDIKISLALWPSDFETEEVSKYYNHTKEFIRSNYLEVNIFFDILGYQQILQVPSYDFLALQSDIGAYMGLLGGASVITIFEFLDCLLATISRRRRPVDLN